MTQPEYFGNEMKAIAESLIKGNKPDQEARAKLGSIIHAAGEMLIEIEKADWGQEHKDYTHMINSWLFDNDLIPEDTIVLIKSAFKKEPKNTSKLEVNLKVLSVLLKNLEKSIELTQAQTEVILTQHGLK